MKTFLNVLLAVSIAAGASAAERPKAVVHTSEGDFTVALFPDKAPKTVENFIALATGKKEWTHPATGKKETKPLYSGTKFHRTIPGFMIQGGDPLGDGQGGPGYKFEDEFSDMGFNKPGLLGMANRGIKNDNGSQFFVTVGTPTHLTNRHTIFGEVVSGMDVVNKIANRPSEPNSGRAYDPVTLKSIELIGDAGASKAATTTQTATSDSQTTR
jgi:peptidyl-prolyl cis-trans isomerase A (cyclophilin A)